MHIEEAINKLELMYANEELSKSIIKHMNYTLNHAPESLINEENKKLISLEDKKRYIKKTLVKTLAEHYNIYNSINSITDWVNKDYPEYKHERIDNFIKQINYKLYGYITGSIGFTIGLGEAIYSDSDITTGIITLASGVIIGKSLSIRKKEPELKRGIVKNYYDDALDYCIAETNAENGIRIIKKNIKSYRDNINYLNNQFNLPTKLEDKLGNLVIETSEFSKEIKDISSSISQKKINISGYYDLKMPRLLWYNLINQNYFSRIEKKNEKKALEEIKLINA